METCSPYRNVVPILVKNLCIKEHDKVIFDCHNSTLIVGLNAKVNSVRELLRDCGKFIERVYFNKIHGLPKSSLIEFAELFAEHLAEQISLEFPTGHNHDLVDIFALKFKEKGVNFTTLKLLMKQGDNMGGLNHPFTADIKVLQFNTIHSRLLNSKWEIIGQSLEEVSILIGSKYGIHSGVCDRNQCIQEMKTHARKLSSISVTGLISRGLGWEESQLLDLFVSYGEQLLNLELGSMSVESYARIVDSCPKVQVALYAENNVFAGISVMAKNLCELTLEYTPYENDLSIDDVKKRVREAMNNCFGLVKLSVYMNIFTNGVVQSIFPVEMQCLQDLDLRLIVNPADLNHIASVTSRLKSVKLSCAYPILTSAIDALACANPELQDVLIFEAPFNNRDFNERNIAETAAVVEDVVASFSKCIKLKNIVGDFSLSSESPSRKKLCQIFAPFETKGVTFKFTFKCNR